MRQVMERIQGVAALKSKRFVMEHLNFRRDGTIGSVLCRICSTPITGFADVDAEAEKIGDQTIVKIRQQYMKFDNYAQLKFELNDGSVYEPPVCKQCAESYVGEGFSLDEYEELFAIELAAWLETLTRAGRSPEAVQQYLSGEKDKYISRFLGTVADGRHKAA